MGKLIQLSIFQEAFENNEGKRWNTASYQGIKHLFFILNAL